MKKTVLRKRRVDTRASVSVCRCAAAAYFFPSGMRAAVAAARRWPRRGGARRRAPLHLAVVDLRVTKLGHRRMEGVVHIALRPHIRRPRDRADEVAHAEDFDVRHVENILQLLYAAVPAHFFVLCGEMGI